MDGRRCWPGGCGVGRGWVGTLYLGTWNGLPQFALNMVGGRVVMSSLEGGERRYKQTWSGERLVWACQRGWEELGLMWRRRCGRLMCGMAGANDMPCFSVLLELVQIMWT